MIGRGHCHDSLKATHTIACLHLTSSHLDIIFSCWNSIVKWVIVWQLKSILSRTHLFYSRVYVLLSVIATFDLFDYLMRKMIHYFTSSSSGWSHFGIIQELIAALLQQISIVSLVCPILGQKELLLSLTWTTLNCIDSSLLSLTFRAEFDKAALIHCAQINVFQTFILLNNKLNYIFKTRYI